VDIFGHQAFRQWTPVEMRPKGVDIFGNQAFRQ
jgi:hypothetical protein